MVVYREYFRKLYDIIEDVLGSQGTRIETAAQWMAESIAAGGVVHLFGSGHSHMVAEEPFHRAGSLTFFGNVNATMLERTSGYARVVIGAHDIREGEIVIVASNSGVNPVPIEAVLEARARGARTIAITSDHFYTAAPSRHDSGKRLAQVADLTIDTRIPQGDALVHIRDVEYPVGGASSVVGVAVINAIVVEATDRLRQLGVAPPVIPTMNLPGGDERMDALVAAYRDRLPLLRRA